MPATGDVAVGGLGTKDAAARERIDANEINFAVLDSLGFSYLYSGVGQPCAMHSKTAPSSCDTVTWPVCSTMLGETMPRCSVERMKKNGKKKEGKN